MLGVVHANRRRPELQQTVGFVSDFLALRVDVSDEPSFAELFERTSIAWEEAREHELPSGALRAICEGFSDSDGRPFDAVLNFTPHAPSPRFEVATPQLRIGEALGREVRSLQVEHEWTAVSRLAFLVSSDARDGLHGWLAPNTTLLPPSTIATLSGALRATLLAACADPHRPLRRAPALSA